MSLRFASALSINPRSDLAVAETVALIQEQLRTQPSLVVAFLSPHHTEEGEQIARELHAAFKTDNIMGCTGESIVGVGTEIEMKPAISIWAASLPETSVLPMRLEFVRTPEGGSIVGWPDDLPSEWPEDAALLVLGDPFTFPPELLLELINDEHPNIPIIGGMASAASQPGENRLICGSQAASDGAVAVFVQGGVEVRTIVSQGCRPIGEHFVITKAERNAIQELGGVPAYQKLGQVFDSLPTREQQLLQRGLHVGRVVSEYQETFEQGDFLIRNVMGIDQESGAIVIGDYVRAGQTVQFHLRDWETADVELKQLLAAAKAQNDFDAAGALLFTCNGRGTRLFPEPNHDAEAIGDAYGQIPLAGLFAAGEIGPVGKKNFLHGFTASIAVFGG
jgi:small ligand-binding sensory domain FIST